MERYLREYFHIPAKHATDEELNKWRASVTMVKNRRRRFRGLRNLQERSETRERQIRIHQEHMKSVLYNRPVALHFTNENRVYRTPSEVEQAGFHIDSVELASMVSGARIQILHSFGGIEGIARCLSVSLDKGVCSLDKPPLRSRQRIFGTNQYNEKPFRSFGSFMWEVMQDTTLIILMVFALASMVLGVATEGWPNSMCEGLGIVFCIAVVILVTSVTNYKQHLLFMNLVEEKKKIYVQVTRDGRRRKLSIYDLVVGDIVHLSVGDQVPSDGIYISGNNLLIDRSCLSGESRPVDIDKENPFLLSGTKVLDGSGKMLVASVGKRTVLGRLMETLSEWGQDETPLQEKLNAVAKIVGKIGLVFSFLVFVVLTGKLLVEKLSYRVSLEWSSRDTSKLLNYAVIALSIFMGAVPECLPLAVILSHMFAMRRLMHSNALLRNPAACEVMGSVSCICTDKTGTLTTNDMEVDRMWIWDEQLEVKDEEILRSAISDRILKVILLTIFKNTSAEVVKDDGKITICGSPIESALSKYGLFLENDFNAPCEVKKFEPFHPERKKTSVVLALPGEVQVLSKGAPEIILNMCDKLFSCNGKSLPLSQEERKTTMDVVNSFSSEGLSTLCFACKEMAETSDFDELPLDGYTLVAVIGIKNPVRPGVKNAVQACLKAGISICMFTGDSMNTAKAVAKECAILGDGGLFKEGSDIHREHVEELKLSLPRTQVIARCFPVDKLKVVSLLKSTCGEVVAVAGDGTNDAPALCEADIGLVMGEAGTEAAKENAHVIIKEDDFMSIVDLIKSGRAVYLNIQKVMQFQLTINIVVLMLSSFSVCISGSAFVTPFQLLWVDIVVGILGSLVLAVDPPTDSAMQRPPVRRCMKFIIPCMWRNIVFQSIYQMIVLSVMKIKGQALLKLNGAQAGLVVDTFIFNTFVFFQVFNVINCREMEMLNVFQGMLNRLLMTVMAFVVILQVMIVEFLGSFSNSVHLSWGLWAISVSIGSSSMIIAPLVKFIPYFHIKTVLRFSLCTWKMLTRNV